MKKLWENIKANKLRSALIGCCAFLFGFISVSIFNSIGDTYAYTEHVCGLSGWHYAGKSGDTPLCCPNGYTLAPGTTWCHADPLSTSPRACLAPGQYRTVYHPELKECTISSLLALSGEITSHTATFYLNGGRSWTYYNTSNSHVREGTIQANCTLNGSSTSCSITSPIPEHSKSVMSFRGFSETSACSTIVVGGKANVSLTGDKNFYACWKEQPACYVCGSSSGGSYRYGNSLMLHHAIYMMKN